MKLICRICSRFDDGGRIDPGAAIAHITSGDLSLPLDPKTFTSLAPERGMPAPWREGVTWDRMFCPKGQHLPWAIKSDDLRDAIKDGGPREILTDEGLVQVSTRVKALETPAEPTAKKTGKHHRGR